MHDLFNLVQPDVQAESLSRVYIERLKGLGIFSLSLPPPLRNPLKKYIGIGVTGWPPRRDAVARTHPLCGSLDAGERDRKRRFSGVYDAFKATRLVYFLFANQERRVVFCSLGN